MTHKEVLESLLSGQIVEREGLLCSYLYKMVDETIYYTIPYGINRYDWKPIEVDDVFKFYGRFSIYKKWIKSEFYSIYDG